MEDRFNLQRFVSAQAGSYEAALAEIRRGAKRGHWMWYIFPQYAGLGRSPIAKHYAIHSLEEARTYLAHPVLGPRLKACAEALQQLGDADAEQVFGKVDAMKLRSCLTLFIQVGGDPIFQRTLDRWFPGTTDELTMKLIAREDGL